MSWRQISGHDDLIDRFTRAARTGRMGHAFLFVGPAGVGKKRFAVELAKALLCEQAAADHLAACDRCGSCRLADAGTHTDLLHVGRPEDKHEFPIEAVRELCYQLSLKPARGRRRVAVVDDADDFNAESANCFLKTLEEPPPGSLLILIGSAADRQLPTIRSRCQVVSFAPLGDDAVAERLRVAGVTDADHLARLTRLAEGSPGRAQGLADPDLWGFRGRLVAELVKPRPDGPALSREWMTLIETAGKDSAAHRTRAAQVLDVLIDAFRRALRAAIGGAADADLRPLVERYGVAGLLARLERLLEAEAHIDRKVQIVLLVEAVVDALTHEGTTHRLRPASVWG